METTEQLRYQAYLFRLWEERPAEPGRPAVWRCSLEDPGTGERHGFGSLEAAVDFLRTRMGKEGDRGMGEFGSWCPGGRVDKERSRPED